MTALRRATVGATALVTADFEHLVRDSHAGATVLFTGVVRDHAEGRTVVELEYEAHPGAESCLVDLTTAWLHAWPEVLGVAVGHRCGLLRIGDVAFVAAVAAAHRQTAFAACADLVNRVKADLPIWKHEVYADGTTTWVGAP
jgi:molybdopterin synthase catalytic subunit